MKDQGKPHREIQAHMETSPVTVDLNQPQASLWKEAIFMETLLSCMIWF